MQLLLYPALIIFIYYLGYVFSLHSLAAFLAQDELETISARMSSFSRRYLSEAVANPRISLQITVIIKSFVMVLTSFLAILFAQVLIEKYQYNSTITFMAVLLAVWTLYLIFMEYFPRKRALRHVNRTVLKYIPLFALLYRLFRPFIRLYEKTLRPYPENVTEEQKEDIVERAIESLAEQAGVGQPIVEENEKEMIGQIFQLDVTEVREVMVPRIDMKGLNKNISLQDVRNLTREFGFSRFPVYDENLDRIIGILYIKDLFTRLPLPVDETSFDITRYMHPVHFVPESKKISDLLAEFKASRVHVAIVVDEYGGTSGLVTMEDILEEIFGDIQDEHDHESAEMVKLPDDSLLVDAGISLEELVEELKLDYDAGEFETVGGLIYDLVGSVPAVGTKLKWKDIQIEVDKVRGQRIISVKVRVNKEPEA